MAQCLELEESGRRCPREAELGFSFCQRHTREELLEPSEPEAVLRKLALRLAALLLLGIFLLPLLVQGYRLLQALLN